MKKVTRSVMAAKEDDSKLMILMDQIQDDFDYALAGLEKLDRTGSAESAKGLQIAETLADAIQSAISAISDNM